MFQSNQFLYPSTQADYDAGFRVFYCPFCPCQIYGDIEFGVAVKCVSCLPVSGITGDPEYRVMSEATWDTNLEQFSWTRTVEPLEVARPPEE